MLTTSRYTPGVARAQHNLISENWNETGPLIDLGLNFDQARPVQAVYQAKEKQKTNLKFFIVAHKSLKQKSQK